MDPRGLLALGRALARTGAMAKIAFGVGALTVLGTVAVAFTVARSHDAAALEQIPAAASTMLAWGAGVLLAFGASSQALRRDRAEGIRDLYRARGGSDVAYLWARVGGLAIELAWLMAAGTIVSGAVAALLGQSGAASGRTLASTAAAVVFSLVFAAVLAPVAMATLGTRRRLGGYLALVAVLGVPELLAGWTARILPAGWEELGSIPGAALAVRTALEPSRMDPGLALRAAAVLALVIAIALLALRLELAGLDGTSAASPRRGPHLADRDAGARA
jgi:hypothetical protein